MQKKKTKRVEEKTSRSKKQTTDVKNNNLLQEITYLTQEEKNKIMSLSLSELKDKLDNDVICSKTYRTTGKTATKIQYCDCNPFMASNAETTVFNNPIHIGSALCNNAIDGFDKLSEQFGTILNCVDFGSLEKKVVPIDETTLKFYVEFLETIRYLFAQSGKIDISLFEKSISHSVIAGLNLPYYFNFCKQNQAYTVSEIHTTVSKLFGYETVHAFYAKIAEMKQLLISEQSKLQPENRLQVNGAIRTQDNSFVFPYAFCNGKGDYVLLLVISDARGNISVWIHDTEKAKEFCTVKETNAESTNTLKIMGRCTLFEIPNEKLLAERNFLQFVAEQKKIAIIQDGEKIATQEMSRLFF